jgi:hypothetical protein
VRVADAQKAKTPKDDQWRIKPEVNGWSYERVMQVRKYGRQLAKTKSLNGLARKLGVRQVYVIDELARKPFIVARPVFMPDMTDPRVREMVTAANLGARHLLYPGAEQVPGPVTHEPGEAGQTLAGQVVPEPEAQRDTPGPTSPPPSDAEEMVAEPEPEQAVPSQDSHVITRILRRGKGADAMFFAETQAGVTLFTRDAVFVPALQAAARDGQARDIPTEAVQVGGQTYRQIVEIAGGGQ